VFRQAAFGARRQRCNGTLAVAALKDVRQIQRGFAVERFFAIRNQEAVGDDIVDARMAGGAGKAQIGDLHRRRSPGDDVRAGAGGDALQIDDDVDFMLPDQRGCAGVVKVGNADEMVKRLDHACAQGRTVLAAPVEAVEFEAIARSSSSSSSTVSSETACRQKSEDRKPMRSLSWR
jgi:hypothetical protein